LFVEVSKNVHKYNWVLWAGRRKGKVQTGLFSGWLTDWEWGALFIFQSHLLWSPSFSFFYFSGWDPYRLKVTMFFWLCTTLSLSCSSREYTYSWDCDLFYLQSILGESRSMSNGQLVCYCFG
jgi:hypothetical protein